mgnify:CR=1 FL=1
MNFHSLDYFLVLAREKNFTRAAEALHITQQSLSSHIAGLEKELGCTLLVRRTPLELTYAGRKFLHYAESIGQTRQTMEREFCDISENQKGELRVGIGYTRGRAIMPHLIPAFQRQYPNVEITLLEGSNDAIQKALLSGGIDLAIAGFPHPLPGVVLEDYYLEHIVLCLSDGLLAQCGIDLDTHRGEIAAGNLSALCDCPFVLGSAEDIGGRIGRGLLRSSGVSPVSKATSENVETLLALCEQGVGACFCPENLLQTALSPEQLARFGQQAENRHFGKPSGLMDQLACALDGAVYIDFAAGEIAPVAAPFADMGLTLSLTDTGGSHAGLTTAYAALPADMCRVARRFGAETLSQVDPADFYAHRQPGLADDRAAHFFEENARVPLMRDALVHRDAETYLRLMNASGRSSEQLLRNIRATLFIDGEAVREEFGEIGFSERGIEGAVALRMSRDAVDALIDGRRVKLSLDLKPALTVEILQERIRREIAEMPEEEFFAELLRKLLPKPLVMPVCKELDIQSKTYVKKIGDKEIDRLIALLKGFVLPISDYAPFEYAVVTAGGVRCDEVNRYTMESLKVKGLYFAGEVLDLDANTGGYNLQIAFSTGRLAGQLKQ